MALRFLLFSFFCFFGIKAEALEYYRDLPAPYNTIEILPFDPRSHFGSRQANALFTLITGNNVKNVIEIGSYLGASTRFIAKLLPEDGKVYAVDHWLGNPEWKNTPNFKEAQLLLYPQFLSNVIHEGLCEKVIPMRMTSVAASRVLKIVPDLIFIDGSHDYESVYQDICAWYPFVAEGGILCGDDFNWGESKPVKCAVLRFAEEHNLQIKVFEDWVWYYEK
jgi:predicted O-methyltransferase YrrM